MTKYIAAIDQGTTSTRFIIFNQQGKIIGSAQKEHQQIYSQPGWVEHDPEEIWVCTQAVIKEVLAQGNISLKDITAVGITNQRETVVVWNQKTGKPYYNAIVWQDTRTDKICNELAEDFGINRFRQKTGLPIATYFSATKIKWLLANVPEFKAAIASGEALCGTIDTFLIWHLTGGTQGGLHITDVTNASRTLLMNLSSLNWDQEILEIMGIPQTILPEIRPSSAVYGHGTGILAGIPIAAILGDQQAALMGQTCFQIGEAKNTYGTGCFMLLNTGNQPVISQHGLLTTVAYQLGDEPAVYALEGSIAIAGALVQWLRDNLGLIQTSDEVETLASKVIDNGGVYFVPAFSGLFAPYWRNDARGAIVGMTRYTNRSHLARAVLEATAWQTREVIDAMKQDSQVNLTALKVDGGMVYNHLLMQFQSDVLGVPVIRPQVAETTALGAAYAAGLATGFWSSLEELRGNWQIDQTWKPQMAQELRESYYILWKKAVTKTFDWVEPNNRY
jgi:glycerol kinase